MNDWYAFYQNRLNSRYIEHLENRYDYFISNIENYVTELQSDFSIENIMIVELGAGCSNISRILYDRLNPKYNNVFFTAVEQDEKMCQLSKINIGKRAIQLFRADALKLDYTESCNKTAYIFMSHGLLEHFPDCDITKILSYKTDKNITKHFHYVPSYKYETPSFGDERLLSKAQWESILVKTKNAKIEQFNNGFDYLIKL